jgi:preprotein translocase subunit SecE
MQPNSDHHGESGSLDAVKWALAVALIALFVVGNAYFSEQPLLYRVVAGVVLVSAAVGVVFFTHRGRQFNSFRKEALVELRKIVWPTRPETIQTTLVVFVVVLVMAVLLYLLDLAIGFAISRIIG